MDVVKIKNVLASLDSTKRLRVFLAIAEGAHETKDIMEKLNLAQSSLSQATVKLEREGLIKSAQKTGMGKTFHLDNRGFAEELVELLEKYYND